MARRRAESAPRRDPLAHHGMRPVDAGLTAGTTTGNDRTGLYDDIHGVETLWQPI